MYSRVQDKSIKEIYSGKELLSIIYKRSLKTKGVQFFTPFECPFQVGKIAHIGKKIIQAHKHIHFNYKVQKTTEFIYVEHGRIEVDIYDNKWNLISIEKLKKGDSMLYLNGGHGFRFKKGARVLEIKQGPYPNNKEVKIFNN